MTLASSQCLRFIDEINGVTDIDKKIREVKRKIKIEKRKSKSRVSKVMMRELYNTLYNLQFQPDYVCIVMDSNKDYDRANKGFTINGITYKRLLGTNGGIKNSTIVYVNHDIYPELKKRLDNGRNKNKEIVPAKLEAYQALICSGSVPLPPPKGIIVVDDCITHFKDNVILINDSGKGEPKLTYQDDYEIEHNDSDGYGLMLPSYSRTVNKYLTGDEETISGMNTRYAWTKGMVYTFDFVEFAEKVAGIYEIKDAWGDTRDIRDAEVILTVSMLKLWDSYSSWEDFYTNCQENGYEFSTTKITPTELENTRNTNYQFLQSYDLTDEELYELCLPTINEIKDALGMDYRKSLAFLGGYSLNDNSVLFLDNYIKALMIEPGLINDLFIRKKIYSMIKKRIELAKKGSIKINANYAMIGGDPYALCQSIFGLEITGLLKSGELYHKYWIDKGANELACFRAPMTCHNNIRKLRLNNSPECSYWYQYITTAILLNAWDTTCDAMNGADKDGDTNMDTDNPILLRNTLNSPTIICTQRKADKTIPTEEDIISSNKLAFNDDIGVVTNHVTSMFDVRAGYEKDSPEYRELEYRIMCGQLYQQNTIDRAKGIIADPMPNYWHSISSCKETKNEELNLRIVASHKPYFMIYVYPNLRKDYKQFVENSNAKSIILFGDEVCNIGDEQGEFKYYYDYLAPVGKNACTVNRISWLFENEFDEWLQIELKESRFDYSILKSNVGYSRKDFDAITDVYYKYISMVDNFHHKVRAEVISKDDAASIREQFVNHFISQCEKICTNEKELCDIIIDLCYGSEKSRQFAWDICGDTIIKNLLEKHNHILRYPSHVKDNGQFEFNGVNFVMAEFTIEEDEE